MDHRYMTGKSDRFIFLLFFFRLVLFFFHFQSGQTRKHRRQPIFLTDKKTNIWTNALVFVDDLKMQIYAELVDGPQAMFVFANNVVVATLKKEAEEKPITELTWIRYARRPNDPVFAVRSFRSIHFFCSFFRF